MISIISELGSTRIRKLNNKIMSIPRMFFPEGLCFSFRIASAGATRGQPTDDPRNTPRTRGMLIAKDRRTAKMAQRFLPVQPIRTTMALLESSANGGDHCRVTPTALTHRKVRSDRSPAQKLFPEPFVSVLTDLPGISFSRTKPTIHQVSITRSHTLA